MKKSKFRKKHKPNHALKTLCFIAILCALFFCILRYVDSRVMPSVQKVMQFHGMSMATKAIDTSVKAVIEQSNATSSDMFVKTIGENGKVTSLSADTVLINSICADVGQSIIRDLSKIEDETVYLPIGIITGFDFLSTKGPEIFKVSVKPLGECHVNYDTSFKSEGINQINYQIWLDVQATIAVVNPLTEQNINIRRKVPIVNTYINGDVPESMLYPFPNNTAN